MNVNIRLATPKDAHDMAQVHMRSWEVAYKNIIPWDFICEKNATRKSLYAKNITDENKISYVVQYNNKTVGIMGVASPKDDDVNEDYYELYYLYLDPDYFRLGIGSKAINYAFNIARHLDKKFMTVWVLEENVNAITFYYKCGFNIDGKVKDVEYGKKLRCIRMVKSL